MKKVPIVLKDSEEIKNIVEMMRAESLNLEVKLGADANWVPTYVNSAVDVVAKVYGLSPTSTEALKRIAHQRRLPQFT